MNKDLSNKMLLYILNTSIFPCKFLFYGIYSTYHKRNRNKFLGQNKGKTHISSTHFQKLMNLEPLANSTHLSMFDQQALRYE